MSGQVLDLGVRRAAELLSARFGVEITLDGVRELSRRGLLPVAGTYKGHQVYSGEALAAFADKDAAVEASRAGQTLLTSDAARYMQIRSSDFGHLVRARRIEPLAFVRGPWKGQAPVYRTGDLDAVLADTSIDWDAVRACGKGEPSLLAGLPDGRPSRRRQAGHAA